MPCKMCEDLYVDKPCSKRGYKVRSKFVAAFNGIYVKTMFKTLRKRCPCAECLVKVICFTNRFDCDSYVKLLASIDIKGNIKIGNHGELFTIREQEG